MSRPSAALALLATIAACDRPEGKIYWACMGYFTSAQECGQEQGDHTPAEVCDQFDLRYCADGDDAFDEEACAGVEAELRQLDIGMDEHGLDAIDAFPVVEC